MESHASRLGTTRQTAALSPAAPRVREAAASKGLPGWRERAPLLVAIAVGVVTAAACVLAVSWLAVVIVDSESPGSKAALPWAVGCAVAALAAFPATLGALLSPRLRMVLLGVASFLLVLLLTGLIALAMSGASEEVELPATERSTLLEGSSR